jgi:hypothetical protein
MKADELLREVFSSLKKEKLSNSSLVFYKEITDNKRIEFKIYLYEGNYKFQITIQKKDSVNENGIEMWVYSHYDWIAFTLYHEPNETVSMANFLSAIEYAESEISYFMPSFQSLVENRIGEL